jgi:predicted Co/Zn/Cd cation transporter (cation efflux family)
LIRRVIVFAGLAALSKVVEYLAGKELPSIDFGILVAYAGTMMVLCFGVAYVHYRNWQRSQRQSDILKAEMHAVTIDGALSAGVGAGFGFSLLLTNTWRDYGQRG